MTSNDTEEAAVSREDIRPEETACNHRVERCLKLLFEGNNSDALRIDSNPEPMYVTVEDGELAFWAFNYTWKCQERMEVEDCFGPFETVVDQAHAYANDGYPIKHVSKDEIDDERKPRGATLGDFV